MRFSLACVSDTGVVREHNEDNFAFFGKVMPAEHQASAVHVAEVAEGNSFVVGVFDGMGGEAAGEIASYIAAKTLVECSERKRWSRGDVLSLFALMEDAVCSERDSRHVKSMGSTATLLAIDGARAYVANIGDSPAMLYAEGILETLSHEHTDAETLRLLGITGRQPGLTQYLGMSDGEVESNPYIVDFEVSPGHKVMLSSDGLASVVGTNEIRDTLASDEGTRTKATRLRDLAIQNGGPDNVTVLLCEALGDEPACKDVIS